MAIIGYLEILLAVVCFFFLWHWRRNISSPVITWPLLGMMPALLFHRHHIHDHGVWVLKKVGGTMEFKGPWFTNMNFWVTIDPKNVHYILSKRISNYQKGAELKEIFDFFGDGIFNSNSDSWKNQRKILHSLMKDKNFEQFVEKTVEHKVVHGLIPMLEHVSKLGMEVDMQDVFQRFTFDNICSIILGIDPNCLSIGSSKALYEKAFSDLEEIAFHRYCLPQTCWKLQRWLQIGEEKKFSKTKEAFYRFLNHKKEKKPQSEAGQKDASSGLLTNFMEQGEHELGAFVKSDIFVRDFAFNLMAAGKDTVSAGLVWFLWLIATNPLVENKILEEMKATLPTKKDGELGFWTAQEVKKLVYLHAALFETLRLYPPVPFELQASIEADILPSGHHIKPNTKMMYFLYGIGRLEEIWGEDCIEFKPERWITEKGDIMHVPSYKFMAFNGGPRTCLGKNTALIEMKLVATAIICNYHVEVVEGHVVSPSNSVVLQMKHGLKVRVTKRNA